MKSKQSKKKERAKTKSPAKEKKSDRNEPS